MKKRLAYGLFASLALTFGLAACGDSGTTTPYLDSAVPDGAKIDSSSGSADGGDGGGGSADTGGGGADTGGGGGDSGPTADAGGGGGDGGGGADGAIAPDGATAIAPTIVGYAYASRPTNAGYTPPAAYTYNASGGAVRVTRSGTGAYKVSFAGMLFKTASAKVTPYGAVGGTCTVTRWLNNAVDVGCFDKDGAKADSRFVLTVYQGGQASTARIVAYAWANRESTGAYTPDTAYSYNSTGSAIRAGRSSVGVYAISFSGQTLDSGNVQVTPHTSGAHCSITAWSGSAVSVRCYDSNGALADSKYLVAVTKTAKLATKAKVLAYVLANDGASASYRPTAATTYNSSGGRVVASRQAAGVYRVTFEKLGHSGGNVQVSGYGRGYQCNAWLFSNKGVYNVNCYSSTGVRRDTAYTLMVIK